MKNQILTTIFVLITFLTSACTSSVNIPGHGEVPCVGLGDEQDPRFIYDLSGWNIAMGIIFFSLVIPPVLVLTDELYCPEGVCRSVQGDA